MNPFPHVNPIQMLYHRRQFLVTLFFAGLSAWTLAALHDEVFHNLPDSAKPWSHSRNEPESYGKAWRPENYDYQDLGREVLSHLSAVVNIPRSTNVQVVLDPPNLQAIDFLKPSPAIFLPIRVVAHDP